MSLPTVRHRPPAAEIDVLCDAVRALLHALDRRHVDLTRLDRAPEVVRVVGAMHCAEIAAQVWRRHGDCLFLAAQVRQAARTLAAEDPALAASLDRAAQIVGEVGLC